MKAQIKKLPIGLSSLEKMRTGNFVYVDKTAYIHQLTEGAGYYFLSRPRRFGKSLLIDTLHHLFAGNETLFQDLYIHPHWDWSIEYPVLKFDLSQERHKNAASLKIYLLNQLEINQQRLDIACKKSSNVSFCFQELIKKSREKYQQKVVILVDEYDAPLLDNITEIEAVKEIRRELDSFYSVIKGEDANLRFVLLTGVSKFSKVSIFSKLNNLDDIGMEAQFSALCGYTQTELEHYFADYLQDVDLKELKSWYNGYHWLGESVYNPFDILLFFKKSKEYLSYWFETGKTHFLVRLLEENHYHLPDLEDKRLSFNELNDFDIGRLRFEVLLFQTGYLTINKEYDLSGDIVYRFSYPNKEVRKTLNHYFLNHYLIHKKPPLNTIYQAFFEQDFPLLENAVTVLFDNIPCNNYTKNSIAQYEGYYASVMYAFLHSLNLTVIPEDTGNKGRIDMTVRFTTPETGKKVVYIFEFKVLAGKKSDGSALRQIKTKNYAAKYQQKETQIFLIGIEFSRKTRNIVGFDWQVA